MKMFDNIKIWKKLIGGFLMIATIVAIVAILGYGNMKILHGASTNIFNNNLIPIQDLGQADSKLFEIRGALYKYLILPQKRQTMKPKFEENLKVVTSFMDNYRAANLGEEEKAELKKFDEAYIKYHDLVLESLTKIDSGKENEVIASLTDGDLFVTGNNVDKYFETLATINGKVAEQTNARANAEFEGAITLFMIISIIGIITAIGLGIIIARSITVPLNRTVEMIREMRKGHLGMRLNMDRKDEIGIMATTMDDFADALQYAIRTLRMLAAGEKVQLVPVPDEKAEISPAINLLIQTIDMLIDQIGTLIGDAKEGRLQSRGDEMQFNGSYRDMILGINQMLDAITIPVNETLRIAERYAQVDFSARFDESIQVEGDLLQLKEKINQVGIHVGIELGTAIREVSEEVNSLTGSAEEAAASVEEITAGSASVAQSSSIVSINAENSLNSIEQVLASMEELTTSVATVASKVDTVSRLSQEANSTTTQGEKHAAIAENGINGINEAVRDVGEIINEIKGQMIEIGKIVEIIGDIADQTNLLALNAAIEAARAGDAGMGFAVVANEVKTLAQESQRSAENIAKIISSLQNQSNRAAGAMNQANEEVSKGSMAITDTIRFFHTIAQQVEDISNHMTEVASLSEEETAAVEEITASVSEVKEMSRETAREAIGTASASEESAAALNQVSTIVENLSVIATRINNSMSRLNT
jgi:methyl-accepting chemotaxis protein